MPKLAYQDVELFNDPSLRESRVNLEEDRKFWDELCEEERQLQELTHPDGTFARPCT